jgi:hypothetical protein
VGGGSSRATGTPSGGGQAAPSQPGGGGKSLQDCMGFWDKGTHMTKQEWRAACQRTLNRLDNLKAEIDGTMKDSTKKAEKNDAKPKTRTR